MVLHTSELAIAISSVVRARPKGREAVTYCANQWSALEECFEHGHNRLDTNLLESKFRPTKIGAKNWMLLSPANAW